MCRMQVLDAAESLRTDHKILCLFFLLPFRKLEFPLKVTARFDLLSRILSPSSTELPGFFPTFPPV